MHTLAHHARFDLPGVLVPVPMEDLIYRMLSSDPTAVT